MSMYTTAQLLAANEQKFKFDPLFLRLFFRESYPFTTEKVYLSQIPGLVNMALYVSPIVSGEVIRSRGGSTSEFTPGYVKPKHEVNPQMTLRRLPDEDPQNLADPAYRRRRIILQNMRDEELAIAQVEEMQAVSAVLKGKYTMTGEAFDPVEVDMGRSAANNITQSGGTEWSKRDKSTYDPTDDIEAYALNASGVVNIIVFDPKGWALFRSFKAVKEKLDTRRGSHSELETAVKDLGKAVSYKGMYGDVAIVVYSGQYVENGVKKNFLPDNTMVLGNTHARGLRTYGCTHSVSGTAASAGAHTHSMTFVSGGSSGAPGSGSPDYSKYSVNTSSAGAHTHSVSGTAASAGAHAHTVGIGAHTHSVAIGSHGHTITVNAAGNAENTVKNIAFNYIVRLA